MSGQDDNNNPYSHTKDKNVVLDGISTIVHGIAGALHADEKTVGTEAFTREKLLDLIMRIDSCNGGGVIQAALNAMHAVQNLMQALSSAGSSGFPTPTELLKQLEAAGLNVAMSALSNLQGVLAGSLFNALSSTFCSAQCGPLGNLGGIGNNPLGALANLAGMSLQEALDRFGSPVNAVTNLSNQIARSYSGGKIERLPEGCVVDLTNILLGNLNLCGLLSGLLNQLAQLATQEPFAGKPGFGGFTFMGKILDIIEALMAAIQAGMALLNAINAMNLAIRCSGFKPEPTRQVTTPVNLSVKPPGGGPGGIGGDVGGGGGFDDLQNQIDEQANLNLNAISVSVVSYGYRSTNELPYHIPKNPSSKGESLTQDAKSLKISVTANSTSGNVGMTTSFSKSSSTNIPKRIR